MLMHIMYQFPIKCFTFICECFYAFSIDCRQWNPPWHGTHSKAIHFNEHSRQQKYIVHSHIPTAMTQSKCVIAKYPQPNWQWNFQHSFFDPTQEKKREKKFWWHFIYCYSTKTVSMLMEQNEHCIDEERKKNTLRLNKFWINLHKFINLWIN